MANGANDSNGQFGGSDIGSPDQQDKPQKPSMPARLLEHFVKGFLSPVAKGAGETITQGLMGPYGRGELRREEHKEDKEEEAQFGEHLKEEGQEHENFLGQLSQQANRGMPMSPDQTNTLMQMGFGKEVVNAINSQAQQAQQSFMQMDKDFKSGAYGNPQDKNTQEFYNFMKMAVHARPEVLPVISEFMKNQSAQRLATYKAALKQAGDMFKSTLDTNRELKVEGARASDARRLEGQRAGDEMARARYVQGQENKRQQTSIGAATERQTYGEELRERSQRLGAYLKSKGVGAGAMKSLANTETAIKTVLSGKIGGANGTDIGDNPDAKQTIIDTSNSSVIDANPTMTTMGAMNKLAFYGQVNGKDVVGKGIGGLLSDAASKGLADKDYTNRFLRTYHDAIETQPDENAAANLLVEATKGFPPEIRDLILRNAQNFDRLIKANKPDESGIEEPPPLDEDDTLDTNE